MYDPQVALRQRLTWFLLLRLGITTCLLGALFFSYRYSNISTPAEKMLLHTIGLTYFISLVSGLLLTRVRNLAVFSYIQVVFDPFFITGIILLTGGLDSPFPFLYHLAILNAAFLLFQRGALVSATMAALGYGGTVDLLYYGLLPYSEFSSPAFSLVNPAPGLELTTRLAVSLLSFYGIAFLGSYLTQRLSQIETLLVERNLAFGHLSSLYQSVVQNLESGLLITNAEGCIEYANGPMAEIVGASSSALAGQMVEDLFPSFRNRLSPAAEPVEFTFQGEKDNAERTLRVTQSPLYDTYSNCIGHLYSVQDITSVKALERGLKEVQELEHLGTHQQEEEKFETFTGLVGHSEAMKKVYQLITKVSEGSSTVLIIGESGTGKELVAQAIHKQGPRRVHPFVPVNCGAIPESLIESELFGHIKGAFTGAVNNRLGLFREAHGGTIFLDEIGELPLSLQVKLLRVLQEREVTPVGSNKGVQVNVRVVAATNRNLEIEIAAGRFREDLFYRLNVISISLPSLRERTGDLPLLIHHFLSHFSAISGKKMHQISPQAMKVLLDYAYPGNIRELENIIQHAVTMTEEDTIRCQDFPPHLQLPSQHAFDAVPLEATKNGHTSHLDFFGKGVSLDAELESYEQIILRAALERAGGVQKKAAEVLGINYRSFRHRLQKYNLS